MDSNKLNLEILNTDKNDTADTVFNDIIEYYLDNLTNDVNSIEQYVKTASLKYHQKEEIKHESVFKQLYNLFKQFLFSFLNFSSDFCSRKSTKKERIYGST